MVSLVKYFSLNTKIKLGRNLKTQNKNSENYQNHYTYSISVLVNVAKVRIVIKCTILSVVIFGTTYTCYTSETQARVQTVRDAFCFVCWSEVCVLFLCAFKKILCVILNFSVKTRSRVKGVGSVALLCCS